MIIKGVNFGDNPKFEDVRKVFQGMTKEDFAKFKPAKNVNFDFEKFGIDKSEIEKASQLDYDELTKKETEIVEETKTLKDIDFSKLSNIKRRKKSKKDEI